MDVSCFENETCGQLISGMEIHQFLFDNGMLGHCVGLCYLWLAWSLFSEASSQDQELHFDAEGSNVGRSRSNDCVHTTDAVY